MSGTKNMMQSMASVPAQDYSKPASNYKPNENFIPAGWQWRMRNPASENWSEWRDGRARFEPDVGFQWQERQVYAQSDYDQRILSAIDLEANQSALAAKDAEIERLREALKPFAELASNFSEDSDFRSKPDDRNVWGFNDHDLTYGDFRRAGAALNASEATEPARAALAKEQSDA